FAVAYAVAIALWPAALSRPIGLLALASNDAVAFPKHERLLYAGEQVWSDHLPRFYQLGYLAVQIPELITLAFIAGLALSLFALWSSVRAHARETWSVEAATLLAVCAPLAIATIMRPVDYDGARHWLFVVPVIACIAARGAVWAFTHAAKRRAALVLAVAL